MQTVQELQICRDPYWSIIVELPWQPQNVTWLLKTKEFFTNSPQYKNAKVANFVLALPTKINLSIYIEM